MGMKDYLQLPDLFTLFNICFGMLSIYFSINRIFYLASASLVVAVIFDYLDGKVARKLNKVHEFGKELDSLSDIVSFGAAPAVFGMIYAGSGVAGPWSTVLAASCVIFVMCGALRLARFNITKAKGVYEGMPITINGIIFPLFYLLMLPLHYYFAAFLLAGALMISSFRIKKLL